MAMCRKCGSREAIPGAAWCDPCVRATADSYGDLAKRLRKGGKN